MNEQILNRSLLKEIVLEQKEEFLRAPRGVTREKLQDLIAEFDKPQVTIIKGVRRCGKSTLLAQLVDSIPNLKFHYLNFEDERLVSFDVTLFNLLLEVFYEIDGKQTLFIFDEIQVIEDWERFVRRLHNSGNKIIITGSNANLLSQELGTKLTGRHTDIELFPFSYTEFIKYQQYQYEKNDLYLTEKRSLLHKYFSEYLTDGGLPIYLQDRRQTILSSLYEDIIMRDVVQRYKIDNIKLFRELTLYLLSNSTASLTYNKVAEYFNFGSVNTVIKYIGYLENCYFFFIVNQFSASLKKQIAAPKKLYTICNAFIDKIGFHLSANHGGLLENLVFLELKRKYSNIFYYKTSKGSEVDFIVYNTPQEFKLIQVTWALNDAKTRERETSALIQAMLETNAKEAWILTESETETIEMDNKTIHVVPVYKWILQELQ